MNVFKTDALIIGGGPAGASAALSLLTYSNLSVCLVEQSTLDQVRVGEHVSASIFELLTYLKLEKSDFDAACFQPSYGNTSYWGSDHPVARETIFTSDYATYQLNRTTFDLTLLEKVMERGGLVLPRTKCLQMEQDENQLWNIVLKHAEEGEIQIQARYLIDATGRKATIARQLGVATEKYDQLVGVGAFLKFDDQRTLEQQQVLETCEQGWWYHAVLPDETIATVFFSDADIVSKHRLSQLDAWNELLANTKQIKKYTSGARSLTPNLWVRNAFSQISNAADRPKFLAIGDAAVAFDPISSMGIGFAITSACHAATLVIAELSEKTTEKEALTAKQQYQQDLIQNFNQYLQLRQQFYNKEKRWLTADFWARRN